MADPTLVSILLRHADGRHQGRPDMACLACTRNLHARASHFDPNQPRDPSGKWSETGASAAADMVSSIHDNGGFTFDPRKGGLINVGDVKGVAVAVPHTETVVGRGANVNRDEFIKGVADVIERYGDRFRDGAFLGGWYSEDRDVYMVEVTELVEDREAAIKLGKERNQEGVFDLGTGEYIDTGGTGG